MYRIIQEQLTEDQLMEKLLAYIKDNRKKIESGVYDYIADSDDIDTYLQDEGYDILADILGNRWQAYSSRGFSNPVIVKNIKGRGFPDYDDVIAETVKNLPEGISEENLVDYVTLEFFDELFWQDLQFVIDNLQQDDFPNFVVVGRSGGYWGVEINIFDMFILNDVVVEKMVSNIIDNFEKMLVAEELRAPFQMWGDPIASINTFYDDSNNVIQDNIVESIANTILVQENNYSDMVKMSETAQTMFKHLDEVIEATIKYFESTDRWVEEIIANEWWEQPVEVQEEPTE